MDRQAIVRDELPREPAGLDRGAFEQAGSPLIAAGHRDGLWREEAQDGKERKARGRCHVMNRTDEGETGPIRVEVSSTPRSTVLPAPVRVRGRGHSAQPNNNRVSGRF